MASMNYCFTVCRAAEEKAQQKAASSSSDALDNSPSSSPGVGAYFFGRFFSFGLSLPISASTISNPFIVKASQSNHIDDNLV
jgi:hypothetical protein